jgi:ribosomal 50S subunit-recycling heat shock protein
MPSGKTEEVTEARATVTAIDLQKRRVSLKEADGAQVVVQAGDAVKNLDQIKVGDEVVVSYTEALAWQVKPAGQGAPGVTSTENVSSAQPGEKPGGSLTSATTITATITAIDMAKDTVTLTGPEGGAMTIKARDPANLRKVKVGDLVDITYSEALAIAVKPVRKK